MPVLSKPPIDDHILHYTFPEIRETTLSNGLTLVVLTRRELPRITFRLGFPFGDKHDGDHSGSCDVLAAMLKKGTLQRNGEDFADAIDLLGGYLEAASSNDSFFVYGTFLSEFSDDAIRLLFEMTCEPLFDSDELAKEQRRMIADLENDKSAPGYLGQQLLQKKLYHPHPYGRYKTAASLESITPEHLHRMKTDFLVPGGACLLVCGDIDLESAALYCEKHMGDWQGSFTRQQDFGAPAVLDSHRRFFIDRPGSEQATVLMGFPLFDRNHPDYVTGVVANKILGAGANSRLFMTLREEKGFTYGAYSSLNCYQESGAWIASGDMRSDALLDSVKGFEAEFARMSSQPVGEEELRDNLRYLVGVFPLRNESAAAQSGLVIFQRLFGLPADYWTRYLEHIAAVKAPQIQELCADYLRPERSTLVVVGDWQTLEGQMNQLGDCRRLDLNLNPIDG